MFMRIILSPSEPLMLQIHYTAAARVFILASVLTERKGSRNWPKSSNHRTAIPFGGVGYL